MSITIIQLKNKQESRQLLRRENKMAADCFLKELTWPDPLEPGHPLNGWHFICFVPCNNRISRVPRHPFALVLSQNNEAHFSSACLCGAGGKKKKNPPRLFTQSQEATLRYVCRDKTRDGRQIWEGQRWSRTRTHRNTHSLCPESQSRSRRMLRKTHQDTHY